MLSNPIAPEVRNTPFKAVIRNGVGFKGSVSGVIQNVGLKIRLIASRIMKEPTMTRPGVTSRIIASFFCGPESLLFIS